MSLSILNTTDVTNRSWLNLNCNSLTCSTLNADILNVDDIVVDDLSANLVTLNNQVSVPNAPLNATTFFSSGSGNLSQTNSSGTTVTYATSVSGGYLPLDGSLPMTGNLDMNNHAINNVSDINGSFGQENDAIVSQVNSVVAPRGQRDLFQAPTTPANGASLIYVEPLDIILSYNNTTGANAIRYSTDAGVNYTNVTFVGAAPVSVAIVGYSPSLALIVAIGSGSNESYTSVDGINFTKGPNLPTTTAESFNIEWFESGGVFVAGVQDVGQKIMTSADGLTWTLRNSPTQALTLKSSNTLSVPVIVAVGSVSPFIQYSLDGIIWSPTVSTVASCRALSWSDEKSEFLALGYNTGVGYRSVDGVTWTNQGVISPINVNDTLKYISELNRYYLSYKDTDGNFSLWNSLNSSSVFVGTHLDGALAEPLTYSLLYLPSHDRFVIGSNNTHAYYGTARDGLKVLNDNIRVRGAPVRVSNYSTYADTTVNNTAVETNVSTNASSVGSLVLQNSQPLGMVITFDLNMTATSVAGDTLTIKYKSGASGTTLLFTHVLTIPALAVSLPININSKIVVRNGSIQLNSTQLISGTVGMISSSSISYTRTQANTFAITAQWGANVNQLAVNSVTMTSDFRNGA